MDLDDISRTTESFGRERKYNEKNPEEHRDTEMDFAIHPRQTRHRAEVVIAPGATSTIEEQRRFDRDSGLILSLQSVSRNRSPRFAPSRKQKHLATGRNRDRKRNRRRFTGD